MFIDPIEEAFTAEPDSDEVRNESQKIVFTCVYMNRRRILRRV